MVIIQRINGYSGTNSNRNIYNISSIPKVNITEEKAERLYKPESGD